jgi:hypothetical protein
MAKIKTSNIALGGICLALTIIFIFGASFVPGIELTLFALSSLFTAIMVIEADVASATVMYVAAVILGLLILPNKLAIIPYAFFFGHYGIFKYYAEKCRSAALQLIIKGLLFAVLLCVGLLAFKDVLLGSISLPDYPVWILIIGGILMMYLYDYIYTLVINYYMRRLKGKIMK